MRLDKVALHKIVAWLTIAATLAFLFVLTAFPSTSIGN